MPRIRVTMTVTVEYDADDVRFIQNDLLAIDGDTYRFLAFASDAETEDKAKVTQTIYGEVINNDS